MVTSERCRFVSDQRCRQHLLEHVGLRAGTLSQVIGGLVTYPDSTFALARIQQERQAATARYLKDRDVIALEQTMTRLDAEEAEAKGSELVVDPAEALTWLRDLPALWSAGDDSGRRLLTEALFEKVEVLGVKSARVHPTPEADAHGWSDAFGTEPILIPIEIVAQSIGMYGRGERVSPETPSPSLLIPVTNVPTYVHRASGVA